MKITELSVRRPVTGVMIFLIITVLGVFTFTRLKMDMLPDLEFPIVAVITQYSGADPESIEQLVTRPIEEAMASVENVVDINSTSSQDASFVLVNFAWGSDMQQAEENVRKNLEIFAEDALPDDAGRPLTFAFDPSLQPVVFMTIDGPGTPESVRRLAEDQVEPYLSRLQGVASAEVFGGLERQIQVRLLPEWIEAYGIPAQRIIQSLQGANVMIPGGRMTQGRQELNISTYGEFGTVSEIEEVIVGEREGVPVHLRNVADIQDTFREQVDVVRANGRAAVMMTVRKQSDANTVEVADRILAELKSLERQLPDGVNLVPIFDQGEPIKRSISNLSSTALLAIFFTAAVLLAFLRSWRSSSIVLVSIPLAILATFAVMDFRGVTLNVISMAGLALAVGMLVDNAIVVLENIFTHLKRGRDVKTAAIEGTREIAMPIIASTLTTVAVFAPILFVPGLAGQMFKDMSLTIVFALVSSLVVALTLVPLLASQILGSRRENRAERLIGRLTFWLDPLADIYSKVLGTAMRHKARVLLSALVVFLGSLALTPLLGVDFLPTVDDGIMEFRMKAGPGTSLWTMDALVQEVEAIVGDEVPEAEVTLSQFGGGPEAMAVLFGQNSYTGDLTVRLPHVNQRDRSKFEIDKVLRERFKDLAGIEVTPRTMALGGGEGDIQVKMFSDNLDQLRDYGARLKSQVEVTPGAEDVIFSMEQGHPELAVNLDRDQIRLLGLSPSEVAATVSTYFLGTTATLYREGGNEYDVFVRAPRDVREDINRLRALPIVIPTGLSVPLSTVAEIGQALGPTAIHRENQRRLATLSITAEGIALGTLISRVNAAIAEVGDEPGLNTVVAGTAEDLKESFMALGIAFLVAILLVYMVMASQFESLLEPFVILFSIPLALTGVILALVVTGTTLQVTALIGLVLLAGIVVNNGIVLVDVLKQKREAGYDLVEAAIEAGHSRLRPVLMTALTTVFGMTPLAFELGQGAELWTPMARAVIGGLFVSTLLTLVVVPTAYVVLAGFADRQRAKRRQRSNAEGVAWTEDGASPG